MENITKDNNFIYLLMALLLFLFSSALIHEVELPFVDLMMNGVIIFLFIVGIHSIKIEHTWRWAVYFLSAILFGITLLNFFLPQTFIAFIELSILLIFFIGAFTISWKQILFTEQINQNVIIGSVVLFLLLGLIWTVIYLILLMINPDAFNGLELLKWQENFNTVAYYSFVTLTTVGYGDISPRYDVAEFFVYIEAIAGIFFMAIVVSTLVGSRQK